MKLRARGTEPALGDRPRVNVAGKLGQSEVSVRPSSVIPEA